MLRRTLFFVISILLAGIAGWHVAWQPHIFGEGFALPRSIGAMAAFVVAIGFLIWAWKHPAGWKTLVVFTLGIGAAWLAAPMWLSISWSGFGWTLLVLYVLTLLWVGTIVLRPSRAVDWVRRHLPAPRPESPSSSRPPLKGSAP